MKTKIPIGQFEQDEYQVLELEVLKHNDTKFVDMALWEQGEYDKSFEIYPEQAKKLIKILKLIVQ